MCGKCKTPKSPDKAKYKLVFNRGFRGKLMLIYFKGLL
jgi:hypothetical protein